MVTKNCREVYQVYVSYGRGRLTWQQAIDKLAKLNVSRDKRAAVLLGAEMIAGY